MTEYFAKEAPIKCLDTNELAIGYEKYLQTAHWKNIKAQLIDGHAHCPSCGRCTNHFEIHHLVYTTLGHEDLDDDLRVLCKKCHEALHKENPEVSIGHQFVKILDTAYPVMANIALSKSEQKILWALLSLVQFGSNECRHKNQKNITKEWLAKQTKCTLITVSRALTSLEVNGFILRRNKVILINPYFALRGRYVRLDTAELFTGTKFAKVLER